MEPFKDIFKEEKRDLTNETLITCWINDSQNHIILVQRDIGSFQIF